MLVLKNKKNIYEVLSKYKKVEIKTLIEQNIGDRKDIVILKYP